MQVCVVNRLQQQMEGFDITATDFLRAARPTDDPLFCPSSYDVNLVQPRLDVLHHHQSYLQYPRETQWMSAPLSLRMVSVVLGTERRVEPALLELNQLREVNEFAVAHTQACTGATT